MHREQNANGGDELSIGLDRVGVKYCQRTFCRKQVYCIHAYAIETYEQ